VSESTAVWEPFTTYCISPGCTGKLKLSGPGRQKVKCTVCGNEYELESDTTGQIVVFVRPQKKGSL